MAPVIDFGCRHSHIAAALPGALLVTVLFFLLSGLGSGVGNRHRWVPADLISGWGVITCLFTIGGVFVPNSIPALAIIAGFLSLAVILLYIRAYKRAPWPVWLVIAIAAQIWILTLINHAGISGWDDIAQWSQNALFLWQHNSFPGSNLPIPYSNRPAYPYALAYLDYIVSLEYSAFVMQAGAMINWLLLASFAWALTAFDETKRKPFSMLMRLGVALALVTLFNPGFNASFTVTGQSDTATSVIVGFLGLLLLHLHSALRESNLERSRALSWQIAMASTILVLLRDMNVILLVMLICASLLVALRERNFLAAARLWVPGFMLSIIFFIMWHEYSQHAILHEGTSPILKMAEWRWSLMPQLLHAAGAEMLKKNGFYALMLGTTGFGIYVFLRGKLGKLGTLGILTGVLFLGYCGFILTAFIGSTFFTEYNIVNAMSFYRYGTHTGLLGVTMLWFLFERHIEPRIKGNAITAIGIFSLILLPLAYAIKPAWLVPHPNLSLCAIRLLGDELATQLPPQSHLAILDPKSDGFDFYIINLELALDDLQTGHQDHIATNISGFEVEKLPSVLKEISMETNINAVLLKHPTTEMKQFFSVPNDEPAYLLLRNGQKWDSVNLPDG